MCLENNYITCLAFYFFSWFRQVIIPHHITRNNNKEVTHVPPQNPPPLAARSGVPRTKVELDPCGQNIKYSNGSIVMATLQAWQKTTVNHNVPVIRQSSVKAPKCWLVCRESASDFNGNPGLEEEKFLWHDDEPPLVSHSPSQNNIELKSLLQLTVSPLQRVGKCGWKSHYGVSDIPVDLWNIDKLYPKVYSDESFKAWAWNVTSSSYALNSPFCHSGRLFAPLSSMAIWNGFKHFPFTRGWGQVMQMSLFESSVSETDRWSFFSLSEDLYLGNLGCQIRDSERLQQ